MARFLIVTCLALVAGSLASCGKGQTEPEPAKVVATADPRIAALTSINDLKVAKETCKGVNLAYGSADADLVRACTNKLSEIMLRDEMSDFNTGLRYFKKQLTDGKVQTLEATAAKLALNRWLRENTPKASNAELSSWRSALPEEDKLFIYSSMRSTINDAWKD